MRVPGNGGVEPEHAFARVHHDDHHVRHADIPARHHDAQLLRHQLRLALAPDARGVDENVLRAVALHRFIDRIARRARNRRNDGALLARSAHSAAWISRRSAGR